MFSKIKSNSNTKAQENDRRPTSPSIVSSDLMIKGDLVSEGELHIDGHIEGDIRCRKLIVGVNAEINGSIYANVIKVYGRINGHLEARSVLLASLAKVTGDVTHERLEIEPGAFLEGRCRHIDEPIPAEQAPEDLLLTDERQATKK